MSIVTRHGGELVADGPAKSLNMARGMPSSARTIPSAPVAGQCFSTAGVA
jgi:hypothetical protein